MSTVIKSWNIIIKRSELDSSDGDRSEEELGLNMRKLAIRCVREHSFVSIQALFPVPHISSHLNI